MKKIIFLLSIFTFLTLSSFAQDNNEAKQAAVEAMSTKVNSVADKVDSIKHWKFTGMTGLNASHTQFWNWVAGGNNNLTSVLYANLTLSFKKDKLAWDSNLDTEIGVLYSADLKPSWRKSNDKLNITTKFGYEMAKSWYISILGSHKAQYTAGYKYGDDGEKTKISDWASPSYTDLSIGIDFLPNDIFTVFVSPIAGRFTVCRDSLLRPHYGVPEDKSAKAAIGLSMKAGVNYTKIKNLKIISTIMLFTPYSSKASVAAGAQKFGNFDVDWDFAISYQFFKAFSVSLMTSLKYYDKVLIDKPAHGDKPARLAQGVQFKEVLGLGVGYSF